MTGKARDLRIDVLKGIGILCVVWGHLRGYFTTEIYIFHMPLFFFLSGMFFKAKKGFVASRFRSLIVPFVLYTLAFALLFYLHGWERPWHRLSIWNPSAVVGPTWFLIALFFTAIAYYGLSLLIRRRELCFLVACAIGLVFYYWDIRLPLDLRQAGYALPFYAAGHFFHTHSLDKCRALPTYALWACAIAFVATSAYCHINDFRFDLFCIYLPGNALWFYIGALAAIILLLNVRYFSRPTRLNRLLASLGVNSLAIMALHQPYLHLLRREVATWRPFPDNTANGIFTLVACFLIITAASYGIALAIKGLKNRINVKKSR